MILSQLEDSLGLKCIMYHPGLNYYIMNSARNNLFVYVTILVIPFSRLIWRVFGIIPIITKLIISGQTYCWNFPQFLLVNNFAAKMVLGSISCQECNFPVDLNCVTWRWLWPKKARMCHVSARINSEESANWSKGPLCLLMYTERHWTRRHRVGNCLTWKTLDDPFVVHVARGGPQKCLRCNLHCFCYCKVVCFRSQSSPQRFWRIKFSCIDHGGGSWPQILGEDWGAKKHTV